MIEDLIPGFIGYSASSYSSQCRGLVEGSCTEHKNADLEICLCCNAKL